MRDGEAATPTHAGQDVEVSKPGDAAEVEADTVADSVADALHDGGDVGEKQKDAKKKADGVDAKKKTDDGPPKIQAKLEGVGRKVYLTSEKTAKPSGPVADVPRTREAVRAFIAQKYPDIVQRYQNAPQTQRAEYEPLIAEVRKFKPGELGEAQNVEKAKELLARWIAIGKKIAAETNSTEAEDLRTLYNLVEKNDMPVWLQALRDANAPKEEQARLNNFFREEAKIYVRDLMTDANSKEFLYCRDEAMYKRRTGPSFESLLQKHLGKGLSLDAAYDAIIDSAQRSNTQVNEGLTGDASGIKSGSGTGNAPRSKL